MHKKALPGWLTLTSLGVLVALTVSACGGGGPGGLSPEEILANAAQATLEIETVQFAIEREGEPPVIEPSTGAKFINANGFYQAPDTFNVTIRADTPFGVQDFGVVWSPAGNTMTIPGLGTIEITENFEFAPTALFQQEGLPSVLTEAMTNVTLEGEETFEGVEVYHLNGTASGESLSDVTAGAVTVDDMAVDVYVNRETFHVVHMALTEGTGDRWLLDMFNYNEPPVG